MNEAIWLPGLVVLATGLVLGVLLAFRLRQTDVAKRTPETPDVLLEVRDLEARRDDLYRRIRAADEDGLGDAERQALEAAAARTLRELDLANQRLPKDARRKRRRREPQAPDRPAAEASAERAATTGRGSHRPLLVGFAFGAGASLIIGLLVYWAVRDAQPREPAGVSAPATGSTDVPHEGGAQLPAELASQVAELEARLAADPEDLLARKELALTLVAGGDFFEAFNQAGRILQDFPDDPDGLLVHGIVRLTMGQSDQAVELFDRVLANHPDHRQALLYRGLALFQTGSRDQAMDTWEMALEMAGGSDAEIEELIGLARSGALPTAPSALPPEHPPIENAAAGSAAATATSGAVASDGFPVEIEVADGASVSPGSTLFVFLRPSEGGPPVAARRVSLPSFPLEITLGPTDSMMGAELPDAGTLVARLDADGSVATTSETDLSAEVSVTKGQRVRLTLGR